MAQFAETKREQEKKQREQDNTNCFMSTLMTIGSLVYMFVLGMIMANEPKEITWPMLVPPITLFVAAMWFLIKPAKVEY
jgi:L-asparagine transporter-like permease